MIRDIVKLAKLAFGNERKDSIMIVNAEYARALLAVQAGQLRATISRVLRDEADPITAHKLAEVAAECEWCECYGGGAK